MLSKTTHKKLIKHLQKSGARILHIDIETMANLAWVWGKYEQNVIAFEQESFLLSVSWKWHGEKEVYFKCLADFKGYKPRTTDDKALTKFIAEELFENADIIVAHNGISFDMKVIYGRMFKHGIKPPTPAKFFDTKVAAKKHFRMNSNKLDDIGEFTGLGRKVKHEGWDMWMGCYNGEKKHWDLMKKYNKQDVLLMERIYTAMLPYMTQHPNVLMYSSQGFGCRLCGSKKLVKAKRRYTTSGYRQQYQCKDCGGYTTDKKTFPTTEMRA